MTFSKLGLFLWLLLSIAFLMLAHSVSLFADFFWFKELDLRSVFWTSMLARWGLGLAAGAFAGLVFAATLWSARRRARHGVLILETDERDELSGLRELREAAPHLLAAVALVSAFLVGSWAANNWQQALMFWHASPFGAADPVFAKDIGFYVFSVPFYRFAYSLLHATLLIATLLALATYVFEGKVVLTTRGPRIAPDAGSHLLFFLGALCALVAVHFQFKMYEMLSMERAVAPGPGYADINAYFPALKALRFIALACAAAFWAAPFGAPLRYAGAGLALLVLGTFGAGLSRNLIQRFIVAPNEIVKETPYIAAGIEHTRRAFGIDRVQERRFNPTEELSAQGVRRNEATIQNIRLWDHAPLLTTFAQLQEIRTYYDFLDVDNDRYVIDGQARQVMLSPRELNPGALPSRIWINEHLTYTHGYGITMGPVNRISREGLPEFFVKDIPPRASGGIQVTRPEIYFGEAPAGYAIVNTRSKEFDYPSGDDNIYTKYQGKGGVPIDSLARRLLFALRFAELKIVLSSDLMEGSRILYHRNIRERLMKAAPFLRYDKDAYMVVSAGGRLHWIVDAYTSTDAYPYAQSLRGLGNYIRNSVKAVVDAYDGTTSFYIVDPADPIVRTYAAAFPGLLKPLSEMPADLRSHLRYPHDLFAAQAYIYSTYHMTDPQVFYNKEDLWKIPRRGQGQSAEPMQPYYTIMKLAGLGQREEFILMIPFTPARKENMIAWMAARCDGEDYGKLVVYEFPKQELVYGPQQIESRIDQDPEISKQLSLWNQGGSSVIRGSLLVIPIDSSLIYVQPLYLEASGGGLPELKRVIVAYGNSIAMEENLEQSLSRIFSGRVDRPAAGKTGAPAAAPDQANLIRQAQAAFEQAQSRVRAGDWAGYGERMRELERLLRELARKR